MTASPPRSPRASSFAAAALAGLALWAGSAGCASAPLRPGEPAVGRALFEKGCAGCHALPEPAEYTQLEWRGLVRKMGPQAGFSRQKQEDVLSWVLQGAEAE